MVCNLGINDVLGDIDNLGSMVVTGGATTIFHGDVKNIKTIQASATGNLTSVAIFLGGFSGNGVSGGGHVFLEGDTRPGFSPGMMNFGGDLSQGPNSRLSIEIGGREAGREYDQLNVAGHLNIGGILEVTLIDGFVPKAGDRFDLWNAGTHDGWYAVEILPPLPEGLFWVTSSLLSTGEIFVSNRPSTYHEFAWSYELETLPEEDEDGDGLSNLLEYALGLVPTKASMTDLSLARLEDGDVFTFSVPHFGGGDISLQVQTSEDLRIWENRAIQERGRAWRSISPADLEVEQNAQPGWDQITLGVSREEGVVRQFYRLSVNLEN